MAKTVSNDLLVPSAPHPLSVFTRKVFTDLAPLSVVLVFGLARLS